MNRWQKLLGMGVLLLLFLPACGLFERPPKEKTAAEKAAEQRARKEAAWRLAAERRATIEGLKAALEPPPAHERNRSELRGGTAVFDGICRDLNRFATLDIRLRTIPIFDPLLTWKEMGIEMAFKPKKKKGETDARLKKKQEEARAETVSARARDFAQRAAESLLYVYSLDRQSRTRDGSWCAYRVYREKEPETRVLRFADGSSVMRAIEFVLETRWVGVSELQMKALALRGTLQRDLQEEIHQIRRARLGPRERRQQLFEVVARAREWNFTPEDLGIRRQELEVRRVR